MNRVKQLREEKHITQEKLAKAVGIDRTTISKVESGERELTLDHLQRISKFFDVSFDYVLGTSNERKNTIQIIDMTNAKDGVTKVQMDVLKKIEDLNEKDIEKIIDYIDYIKSKGDRNWNQQQEIQWIYTA